MPSFRYKAVTDTGKLIKGIAIALDETDVERNLARSGLTLISAASVKPNNWQRLFGGRVKLRALVEFYHRLAQTLEIGFSMLSALEENGRYLPSLPMRKISSELKTAVECGRSLYEAMEGHPKVFQKLDLAIIKMGELTGVLPAGLKQLAAFLQWKEELGAQVRKAAIYPCFVMVAILAVLGVWIGYVLPQMVAVLAEMDVAVPAVTQTVLQISNFVRTNWPWLLAGALLLPMAVYIWQKTESGGLRFHQSILSIPLLGRVLHNIALARLCHNFATMFAAGMAIQQIFTTLADHGLGNRWLEKRFASAFREIERGESIAEALQKVGGFPSLLLGAVRNGESTGTLDQVLKRLGDYFDAEVKRTVQALLSAIEPMAIIALGAVFGMIVLSILLPLYDIMGSMGNAY